MKHAKKIKKVLNILLLAIVFGLAYSLSFTVYENIRADNIINEFKSRTNGNVMIKELPLLNGETYIRKYNEVTRETWDEKNTANVFMDDQMLNIGQVGDIFATRQSPFPTVPVFHQFMSYYYGGHASIKVDETTTLESTGFPDSSESILSIIFSSGKKGHGYSPVVEYNDNHWLDPQYAGDYFDNFYRSKFFGLRMKDPFKGEEPELYDLLINTAVEQAHQKYEDEALYNFLFFLNTRRKYYCTDFVSRVYEEAVYRVVKNKKDYISKGYAKSLNDDGFITSVNDLLLSRDSLLTFYVEIKEELYEGEMKVVQNIYFLENI